MTHQITTQGFLPTRRPKVRLRTLGAIDLNVDGRGELRSVLHQPKRLALLAYLAVARPGAFHRRDTVMGLFWPERDNEHARGALRQAVRFLRRHLGESVIVSRGEEDLGIGDEVWCDAAEFERAVRRGEHEEAIALYRGDLLAGVYVAEAAAELDQWIESERSRLRELAARTAWALAVDAESRGRVADASHWARQAMALSPQDESALRQLISLLDRLGDRAGAIRTYEDFSRQLATEYDTDPSAETRALVDAVRLRERVAPPTTLVAPPRVAFHPASGSESSLPNGDDSASEAAPITAAAGGRRRRPAAAAGALLMTGILGIAVAVLARREAHRPVLAVGAIRDHTAADSARLTPAVADLLATNVARLSGVQVISTPRLYEILAQGGTSSDTGAAIARAARQAGASEILEGALYRTPTGALRLDIRRVGLDGGSVRSAYLATGAHPFALVDSITSALARDLDVRSPHLGVADVTTSSLVAHRFYEEGLRIYNQGDAQAAERLFAAATAEDSSFAMAVYYLGVCRLGLGDELGAVIHLRNAAQLAARATERERLIIRTTLAFQVGDPSAAALAETLATRYSTEPDGHLYVGRARKVAGDFLGAVPYFHRVIAMDSLALRGGTVRCRACEAAGEIGSALLHADSLPAAERFARQMLQRFRGPGWVNELGIVLEREGRADEALTMFKEMGPAWSADGWAHRVRLAIRTGDFDEADRILTDVVRHRPEVRGYAHWLLSISLRYQGRLADGLRIARQLRRLATPPREGSLVPGESVVEAQTLFEMGRTAQAAALFDSIGRNSNTNPDMPARTARNRTWMLTHVASSLAAGGDTTQLARLADSLQAEGRKSGYGRDPRLHHHARALLWRAREEPAEAEAAFRRAIYSTNMGYTRTNFELGRLFLEQNRPREAVQVLGAALRGPLDASNLYLTHTDLHELIARAHDALGSRDSAIVHYRYVTRAWRSADPQFHTRRDAARRRLAQLEAT